MCAFPEMGIHAVGETLSQGQGERNQGFPICRMPDDHFPLKSLIMDMTEGKRRKWICTERFLVI